MQAVPKQHIVDVVVWGDDRLPKQIQTGRPSPLTDSKLLTILIWDGLTEPHKNLSAVYAWMGREYSDCFPKLPRYQNVVAHGHRLLPPMAWFLQTLRATDAALRVAGSAMLTVTRQLVASPSSGRTGKADITVVRCTPPLTTATG